MKNIITVILMLNLGCLFAQTDEKMDFKLDEHYKNNSIQIENSVGFYKDVKQDVDSIEAVRFTVKITNLGNQPIPNFENVTARSKFLKLYINDKDSKDLNIQNGIGPTEVQYIGRDESDVFETAWSLTEDSGINQYKNPIKVRWSYLGISSAVVTVNIAAKKVIR